MLGLMFLAVVLACAALVATTLKQVKTRYSAAVTWSLLLVILGIPIADAWLSYKAFDAKCTNDGEILIHRVGPAVGGIAISSSGVFSSSPDYFGYDFIESTPYEGQVLVDRAVSSGVPDAAVIMRRVKPQAKYVLREFDKSTTSTLSTWHISIREISTDEELASYDWFQFRGGLMQRTFMMFTGAGTMPVASCGSPLEWHNKTLRMLHSTLPPARTTNPPKDQ